jgi:hypothetical protein
MGGRPSFRNADALQRLSGAPEAATEMAARARKMLDAYFTREHALARRRPLLHCLDASPV